MGQRRELLLRPPPEAPALPILRASPAVVKKIKTQQPRVPQGEEQPPPTVVEHSILGPYTQAELVDLNTQVRQKPLGPLPMWLLCFGDLGVEGIVLSGSEMGKLASQMTHPSLAEFTKWPSEPRESRAFGLTDSSPQGSLA